MNDMSKNARLLPPSEDVEDAVVSRRDDWQAYLRPPKLWKLTTAIGFGAALALGFVVWSGASDREAVRSLEEMQRHMTVLQSQTNSGSANTASIQSQLAGLQTQLVVLQNQMFQLQTNRAAGVAAPVATVAVSPAKETPLAVPEPAKPGVDVSKASAADLSALINEGLKGKDRATDPVYQQIMYSALDLSSAYRVSVATWGPEPSPLAGILETAPIASFAFKPTQDREGVLVLPKTDDLRQTLLARGLTEVSLGDQVGFRYE